MGPDALQVYLHENRIGYPVGVDAYRDDDPATHPLPLTMRAYATQGTPTLFLIDRPGPLRRQRFGLVNDPRRAAAIAPLLPATLGRPEKRRGRQECISPCQARWWPSH